MRCERCGSLDGAEVWSVYGDPLPPPIGPLWVSPAHYRDRNLPFGFWPRVDPTKADA